MPKKRNAQKRKPRRAQNASVPPPATIAPATEWDGEGLPDVDQSEDQPSQRYIPQGFQQDERIPVLLSQSAASVDSLEDGEGILPLVYHHLQATLDEPVWDIHRQLNLVAETLKLTDLLIKRNAELEKCVRQLQELNDELITKIPPLTEETPSPAAFPPLSEGLEPEQPSSAADRTRGDSTPGAATAQVVDVPPTTTGASTSNNLPRDVPAVLMDSNINVSKQRTAMKPPPAPRAPGFTRARAKHSYAPTAPSPLWKEDSEPPMQKLYRDARASTSAERPCGGGGADGRADTCRGE